MAVNSTFGRVESDTGWSRGRMSRLTQRVELHEGGDIETWRFKWSYITGRVYVRGSWYSIATKSTEY